MRRRLTTGIVTAVAAVAMAVPASGLANKGGTPHSKGTSTATCPVHKNKGKHKGQIKNSSKGLKKGSSKGKKCGKSKPGSV